MTEPDPNPDADILAAYVELQALTPCRKCKGKEWTHSGLTRWVNGGDRVGKFVVLGSPHERVVALAFNCSACNAVFERPIYSRDQLASQEYPAVVVSGGQARLKRPTAKLDIDPDPNNN